MVEGGEGFLIVGFGGGSCGVVHTPYVPRKSQFVQTFEVTFYTAKALKNWGNTYGHWDTGRTYGGCAVKRYAVSPF